MATPEDIGEEVSFCLYRIKNRQGYSWSHIDQQTNGEIIQTALLLLNREHVGSHPNCEYSEESYTAKDHRNSLIMSAALIFAEIQRLDRIEDGVN